MSNSIFRIFNPGAPKEDPKLKRRGQLRRAQQTYRDRKEKYTRLLERELAQTRSNEARLVRECEDLRVNVLGLVDLLSQHNITLPPKAPGVTTASEENTDWCDAGIVEALSSPSMFSHETFSGHCSPGDGATTSASVLAQRNNNTTATSDPDGSTRVCDLDQVILGMEFILKIEEPCLDHLHGDPQKPDDPSGHALTTSAHLLGLSDYPRYHTKRRSDSFSPYRVSPVSKLDAPAAVLERLLSSAPDLSGDGEITPVEAWDSIRHRSQFGGFAVQDLRVLGERLRKAAKCHGFGAVIRKQVFESLVYEALILKRPF